MEDKLDKKRFMIYLLIVLTSVALIMALMLFNKPANQVDNKDEELDGDFVISEYLILSESAIEDSDISEWYEENKEAEGVYHKSSEDKTYVLINTGLQSENNFALGLVDLQKDGKTLKVIYEKIASEGETHNGDRYITMLIETDGVYENVYRELLVREDEDMYNPDNYVIFNGWIDEKTFEASGLKNGATKTYTLNGTISDVLGEATFTPGQTMRLRFKNFNGEKIVTEMVLLEGLAREVDVKFSFKSLFFEKEEDGLIYATNLDDESMVLNPTDRGLNSLKGLGIKQGDLVKAVIFDGDTVVEFKEILIQGKVVNIEDIVKISGVYEEKVDDFVTIKTKGNHQEFHLGESVFNIFENEEIKIGDIIEVSVCENQEYGINTILSVSK